MSQSANERLAAEHLRWHINCLIKVAKSLVTILEIPSFSDVRSADHVLLNLWQSDILEEYEAYRQPTEREIGSRIRQTRRLFKSLKDHTHEKIDWKILDEWKHAWDSCLNYRFKLKKEARENYQISLKKNQT